MDGGVVDGPQPEVVGDHIQHDAFDDDGGASDVDGAQEEARVDLQQRTVPSDPSESDKDDISHWHLVAQCLMSFRFPWHNHCLLCFGFPWHNVFPMYLSMSFVLFSWYITFKEKGVQRKHWEWFTDLAKTNFKRAKYFANRILKDPSIDDHDKWLG